MPRKKTNAQFLLEVEDLVKDEYTFLESYVNTKTKIKVRHNKCGHVYSASPAKFLTGRRCPACRYKKSSEKQIKSNKEFLEEVYNLTKNEYSFLEEYSGANKRIKVKHNNNACGNHEYLVTPSNFLRGSGCPECNGFILPRVSNSVFVSRVINIVGDEYQFTEPYVNAMTKINVRHTKCGASYKVSPSKFIEGSRCPYCSLSERRLKLRKSNTEFIKEAKLLVGKDYTFLEPYVDHKQGIEVRHNICGNVYKVTPKNFLRGCCRCPRCFETVSKGEREISFWLDKKMIEYETEYYFEDLYYKSCKHPLRFDFGVFKENKLHSLIEFDGEQHFRSIGGRGKAFKQQVDRDKLKNEYCSSRKIPLIRIAYTDYSNIDIILAKFLLDKRGEQ